MVTAQRREENLQDVPVSVSAINQDALTAINSSGADIRALSGRVPSLLVESSFGRTFPRFYIRGLGNTDFDFNAAQPVSLVYDDVVLENPILKGFPIFDMQQVEVLRGPQGTLFGRNTPAGIVKFDSVKPRDYADGYARVSYGGFDTVNLKAPWAGRWAINVQRARISRFIRARTITSTMCCHRAPQEDAFGGYDELRPARCRQKSARPTISTFC